MAAAVQIEDGMKWLVIAHQPFFTHRGTPFGVYNRTSAMAELGEELVILTYGQGFDVSVPGVRTVRGPRFKIFGDMDNCPLQSIFGVNACRIG